jgi:3-oxoacyl-[acyl-carrier-protein] synthase II
VQLESLFIFTQYLPLTDNIITKMILNQLIIRNYSNYSKRRVVVTGLGVFSALGSRVETAWQNVLAGKSVIRKLPEEQYSKIPCKIAAQIDEAEVARIRNEFPKSELKTMSPAIVYALYAVKEAIEQAQWQPKTNEEQERTGVAIGMGMVDLQDVCDTHEALKKSYNRISPFFVPRILPNMAAGQISIKYKLLGPNHSVSTACATGLHSIGDAFRFIQHGDADVMFCGGSEASISPLSIAGFSRLRALSTSFNDTPEIASLPFDTKREGFVMGEGASMFILEELGHALKRNARIIGEILGYGLSGDASHLTAPSEDGRGARLAMERAINDAGLKKEDISYVNCHATSTPIGDAIEARSIKNLFGPKGVALSSTKGSHGHLLGAAGNLEALFTLLACREALLPPTINLHETNEEFKDMNFVANKSQKWETGGKRRIALKNSFGFGGTNASLCIGEFVE